MNENIQYLGGLGPTYVGSPKWKHQMDMKLRIKQYSEANYLVNKMIL